MNNEQVVMQGTVADEVLTTVGTVSGETLDAQNAYIFYRERMLGYYPQIIRTIKEFQAIIDGEYPEYEDLDSAEDTTLDNAYIATMDEDRVEQWENMLGIQPLEGSSLDDRRDTILARVRGQGKLNTALINSIVNAFTGGSANSWVADSTLYVEITPPPDNKQFQFANVEQELQKKIPAHLGMSVSRNYSDWNAILDNYATWQAVLDGFDTWNDVYLFVPTSA